MASTERQLISPTEAAKIAGVDPRTLSRWVRQSYVPGLGFEIGGRLFIRRASLERLVHGEEGGVEQPQTSGT